MSASCNKCVKVLRDLISGLQQDDAPHRDGQPQPQHQPTGNNREESPPLTLLKAIAGSTSSMSSSPSRRRSQQRRHQLTVEEVEDGIRLTIPVETTLPSLLRRWTKLPRPVVEDDEEDGDGGLLQPLYHAMATSANRQEQERSPGTTVPYPNDDHNHRRNADSDGGEESHGYDDEQQRRHEPLSDPLTIELKCRKCASSGPEGGARAFLMGPQPLSVVLCHNRIAATEGEVEEILTHELVHLFDVQTLRLDLQDCENLAYSEVRAAKAAECRDSWRQLQPYCVKQKAISATNNLFPQEGRECIRRVFRTAFADNRPFPTSAYPSKSSSSSSSHHHHPDTTNAIPGGGGGGGGKGKGDSSTNGTSHGTSNK